MRDLYLIIVVLLLSVLIPDAREVIGHVSAISQRLYTSTVSIIFPEPCKPHMSTHIWQPDEDGKIDRFYRSLVRCRDVTKGLSFSQAQGGCVVADTAWSFPVKGHKNEMPNLEELEILNYAWVDAFRKGMRHYQSRWPWEFLKDWLSTPQDSVELWRMAMDWGKLRRLTIDMPPPTFLNALKGELRSLESLHLKPKWSRDGQEMTVCDDQEDAEDIRRNQTSFILSLPPLRELSISGTGSFLNLLAILEKHGNTIQNLTLHDFEQDCSKVGGNSQWTRPYLAVEQISQIRTSAPNLQHLGLAIFRDEKTGWPTAIFEAIAEISHLKSLTVYFDLEEANNEVELEHRSHYPTPRRAYKEPRVTVPAALSIFKHIRERNSGIKEAIIHVGNMNRRDGAMMRSEYFSDNPNRPRIIKCWFENEDSGEKCKKEVDSWTPRVHGASRGKGETDIDDEDEYET